MKEGLLTFELYGELGEKYGKEFHLDCCSVSQGVAILSANFKDFRRHLIDSDSRLAGYEVWCGDRSISGTKHELCASRSGTIKIIPVVKGSSANARIVMGAVLTAIGSSTDNTNLTLMGIGMMAGGIAERLSPRTRFDPQADTGEDDKATSYIFSGPTNNIRQGSAIAVGYGRMIVGSNVVSSSVTTVDVPV